VLLLSSLEEIARLLFTPLWAGDWGEWRYGEIGDRNKNSSGEDREEERRREERVCQREKTYTQSKVTESVYERE
jgi:hypothetical protein